MNQFDLTKFSHIIPPENEKATIRSNSLIAIQMVMENLTNLLQSYYKELQSLDQKAALLSKREDHLKEYEFEIKQKEKALFIAEDTLKQEKTYVENANRDLKKREEAIIENKNYLEEIEESKKEWEKRKTEALKVENRVEDKMKIVEVLNVRQQELDEQQAIIEKEKAIDGERKRLLDIREERIRSKEMRLLIEHQE